MTLRDSLGSLKDERLDLSKGHLEQLEIAVGHFERANGGAVPLEEMKPDHVRRMMRALIDLKKAPRTVNNYTRSILNLWDMTPGAPACPRKEIRLLIEPERYPTAWRTEQVSALVDACRRAPVQRGWGPDHWLALILTVYDTSLRIGCLLRLSTSALCPAEGSLLVPGELQKGRADTFQRLHPDTIDRLVKLPRPDDRLFPWPYVREELWRRLESLILIPAGLPHGRRDKFHRLRRTSYTLVAKAFGVEAASRHAAHKQDLSRFYLDRSQIDADPLQALPRPV